MLIASAAHGSKNTAEVMQSYMNTLYTENKTYMDSRDASMKKELEDLTKVEWKDVLSLSPIGKAMKKGRILPKEGNTIEEIL